MITLKSPAKVNLALDVLGKDEKSGYHEIQTVYQEIPLYDEITIEEIAKNEIQIEWRPLHHNLMNQYMGTHIIMNQNEFLMDAEAFSEPKKEDNTAVRAARLIKEKYGVNKGLKIKKKKNIPLRSGLGGGSSNAAAVLKGLNVIWNLGLNVEQLRKIAAKIGMDVAFFIEGGTAYGTHFGEKIEMLPSFDGDIMLFHTGLEVESRAAYAELDCGKCGQNKDNTKKIVEALRKEKNKRTFEKHIFKNETRLKDTFLEVPKNEIFELFHNDFEYLIQKKFPRIASDFHRAKKTPAKYVGLSGSGGMIFSVY
ncbi:hypothetical protein HYV57_05695 [Candidatus Peregrinibacteria bacterium]|nr:hypothetical protein [Candidatus Peregrinibacteria bacterium]